MFRAILAFSILAAAAISSPPVTVCQAPRSDSRGVDEPQARADSLFQESKELAQAGRTVAARVRLFAAADLWEKSEPGRALEPLLSMAEHYQSAGLWQDALDYLARILEMQGPLPSRDRANILKSVAWSYFNLGRYDLASKRYIEALKLGRNLPDRSVATECLIGLAGVSAAAGQFRQTELYLEEAGKLQPAKWEGKPAAAALRLTGRIHLTLGQHERARACFARARRLDPNDERDRQDEAQILCELSGAHLLNGQSGQALETARQAFQLAPQPDRS